MKKILKCMGICLTGTLLVTGCIKRDRMSEMMVRPFQEAVDEKRQELKITGVSAAVILPDGTTWTGASGNSSDQETMNSSMLFGLGSITKTYVAALILQLEEEGALSVEDPIGRWITGLGRIDENITIRQLLNHTSGLYRYQQKPEYYALITAQPEKIWSAQEIVDTFQGEPECQPGACWGESAMDYVLLGMVVEKAGGSPVSDQLVHRFMNPLKLEHTFLYPDQIYPVKRMAHMWWDLTGSGEPVDVVADTEFRPLASLFSSLWTSGAMHATAEDLACFIKALFKGRVLGEDALKAMLEQGSELYPGAHYGFSVIVDEAEGKKIYWHSGGAGYSSIFYYMPQEDLSIAVLCNQMIDPKPISEALYEVYRKHQK